LSAPPTLLLATADSGSGNGLSAVLGLAGWRVQSVSSGRAAAATLRGITPDAVIVDQKLPDVDGLAVVTDVRRIARGKKVAIAVLVDNIQREQALEYVKAGVDLFLAKPLDLMDVSTKLAERVDHAQPLDPPRYAKDALAKPVVVIASPSLNARDTVMKAVSDECDVIHFDGAGGLEERKRAGCLFIDEGLPGGLAALDSVAAIFGRAPAYAMAGRGAEVPHGFAGQIPKPLRAGAVQKAVRAATDRRLMGLNPLPSGAIIRLREGWFELGEEPMSDLLQQLEGITRLAGETRRTWICLMGPYLGAPKTRAQTRQVLKACERRNIKVGIVTAQSSTTRVAHDLQMHPTMVHQSSTSFIKLVQELV